MLISAISASGAEDCVDEKEGNAFAGEKLLGGTHVEDEGVSKEKGVDCRCGAPNVHDGVLPAGRVEDCCPVVSWEFWESKPATVYENQARSRQTSHLLPERFIAILNGLELGIWLSDSYL